MKNTLLDCLAICSPSDVTEWNEMVMTNTDLKISAHQQAANALLGVCKQHKELSVADIIMELDDGRYVSANEGLVDIVEEDEEPQDMLNPPQESIESLRDAGLTIVDADTEAQVARDVEQGAIITLTREHGNMGMKKFRVLASYLMIDLLEMTEQDMPEVFAVLDPEAILAGCHAQFDIEQPEDWFAENVELSYICLVYTLAMNLVPKLVVGEIMEYFEAVIDLYPDFIDFSDEVWIVFAAAVAEKRSSGRTAQS